jgi:uncharacterized membrane protein
MRIRGVVVASAVASLFLAGVRDAAKGDDAAMGAKVKCEGVNSCKGQRDCSSVRNSCKGQNDCRGQGFKELSQAECDTARAKLKDKKN